MSGLAFLVWKDIALVGRGWDRFRRRGAGAAHGMGEGLSSLKPELQVKLLKLIEDKRVRLLGSTQDRPADV
jgi:hypothetical protein